MFNPGDVILYPFPGYGKGTVVEVGTSEVFGSTSDITYRIEFELGNIATLFDNPRLVAWNPNDERIVEMANQYTKATQLAGKKTKGRSEKATKAPKAPKPEVKKAKDATKSTNDREGWIPLKDAATRTNMSLSQFWTKKLVTKEVESKQFGTRWYIKESSI